MFGWHHRLSGHEFEQALGDSEGQGSLVCCSPWGCKELDVTERLSLLALKVWSPTYSIPRDVPTTGFNVCRMFPYRYLSIPSFS